MKKGKARTAVTAVTGAAVEAPPQGGTVSAQHIERRAYELYLRRGERQGSALEDWLQAERELSREDRVAAPKG